MIDVIIPAYNAYATIEKTLDSITQQTISNMLNVYVVNDCSNKDYTEIINKYKKDINIKEIKLGTNSGPGVARQKGIDSSNGKYILFIDSDDIFYTSNSIELLYKTIENGNYDEVISMFYYEEDDGSFTEKYNELIWLHGKIYRRSFLKNNDIKFNNTRANEDTGFNKLVYLLDAKIGFLDKITYVYMNNPNSITRINNRRYSYTGVEGYIYNIVWATKIALKKGKKGKKLQELLYQALLSTYFYYLQFQEEKDSYKIIEKSKELKKIYLDNDGLSEVEKANIYIDVYKFFSVKIKNIDTLTRKIPFQKFLDKIQI